MTTYTRTIQASTHDGDESSGTVDYVGISINVNNAAQLALFAFTNVTIPQGSTINSADITLDFISGSYDDPYLRIQLEDADTGTVLDGTASEITNRTKTTAYVDWIDTSVGIGAVSTPDLAAIVQDVIDRPGWSSGNTLTFTFTGLDAASNLRVSTYDNGSGEAQLNIDYTAPAATGHAHKKLQTTILMSKIGGGLS